MRVEIRVWESGDRATQDGSDHVGREDKVPPGTERAKGVEWRRWVGASVAELQNAARQCVDGTEGLVTAAAMPDRFASYAVLLRREREGYKRGGQQIARRTCERG